MINIEVNHITFLLYVALQKPDLSNLAKITGISKSTLNKWKKEFFWDNNFEAANQNINKILCKHNLDEKFSLQQSSTKLIMDFINSILQRLNYMKSSINEMEIDEILKTTQILSRAVQPLSKIIKDIEDNEKLSKEDEFWLKTINQNEEIQQAAQNLIWKIQHLQEDNLRQD
jgi:hypothetical protein